VRPRQARYQAALRPDKNCLIILMHHVTLLQRGKVLLLAAVLELKQSLELECVARPNFCSVQIFKQDGRTSSLLAACGRRDLAELSACVLHGMCRAPHW
jgi:hypothetical protein